MMSEAEPLDIELNSKWPYWIRQVVSNMNGIEAGVSITITNLSLIAGAVGLTVGAELSENLFEVVFVSGGAADISNIYAGLNGQIKIFIFLNALNSFTDGLQLNDAIYLNQLPALSNFDGDVLDVLALVNIGGSGIVGSGYWKEMYRQVVVK